MAVAQATNHHHTQAVVTELMLVSVDQATSHHTQAVVMVPVLVMAVAQATNHHHSQVVVAMELVLVSVDQAHKFNNMLPMLKVSSSTTTHKSLLVQPLVVFKPINKTLKFDSFNHHHFHHQE
mgnify:FL=1